MHNAERPHPPASVRDTGGQGELWASSNTRARNSLRAVVPRRAPTGGVHGEVTKPREPSRQRAAGRPGDKAGRNGSERRAGLKSFNGGADPPLTRGRPPSLATRGTAGIG